jgi:hypothetical protein
MLPIERQLQAVSEAIVDAEGEMEKVSRLQIDFIAKQSDYEKHLFQRIRALECARATLESVMQLRASLAESTETQ